MSEKGELTADILRDDGIVERFYFHNVDLTETDHHGNWELDVRVTKEQLRKLSEMAGV